MSPLEPLQSIWRRTTKPDTRSTLSGSTTLNKNFHGSRFLIPLLSAPDRCTCLHCHLKSHTSLFLTRWYLCVSHLQMGRRLSILTATVGRDSLFFILSIRLFFSSMDFAWILASRNGSVYKRTTPPLPILMDILLSLDSLLVLGACQSPFQD